MTRDQRGASSRLNLLSRVAATLAFVLATASVVLRVFAQLEGGGVGIDSPTATFVQSVAGLSFTLVGIVLILKRPSNPIGWLLVLPLDFFNAYAEYALIANPATALPFGDAAATADVAMWTPFVGVVVLVLLLFPSGRFSTARWRVLGFGLSATVLIGFLLTLFTESGLEPLYPGRTNPLTIEVLVPFRNLTDWYFLPLMLLVPVAALDLFRRFRKSAGEERLQFRWLAFSAGVAVAFFPIYVLLGSVNNELGYTLFSLSVAALPASIAIAVLKYRLYDIDVIINRTLVYGSLTGATVGSYVLLVFALSWAARALTGEQGNEVVVAATTLIVAALFQPARRRIQRLVDRRFYRSRYDAGRTIEAFQATLRDEIDLPTLQRDLARVVSTALQPEAVGVWLRPGGPR
ncbi:MAG: hypothetical protein ACSLFM_01970 [Tepidiformaceae bacterium]